jgi:hypothetical protein
MLDLDRAFRIPFKDPAWTSRIGLGAVIQLVPILNFAGLGYQLEVMRRARDGDDATLPTWDNMSALFSRGARMFVVDLIYALPIILVFCGFYAAWFGLMFSIIPLSSGRSGPSGESMLAWTTGMMAASVGFTCVFFLIYLYLIAIMILIPLTRVQMLRTGSVAACLRLGDLLRLFRQRPGEYLGASLMLAGSAYAGSLLSILGPLLLLITPYAAVVTGHVFGQIAREAPAPPGAIAA